MNFSMGKASLPPGFRFHPTDIELVKYYLKRKVMGRKFRIDAIAEVDIYKYAPWDLPAKSTLRSGDLKWYFFCPREKKYANGARMNRATDFGYWKTTGKDRPVHYNNEAVGMIKTLVFHRGKAPKGDRTDWVMHEYRIGEKDLANRGVVQDAYVLCIVFQKEGPGPRNGAQYGAPFKEEEWDDDEDEDVECMEVVSSAVHSIPVHNQISPLAASLPCVSDVILPVNNMHSPTPENNVVSSEVAPVSHEDDIDSMLAYFTEDSTLVPNENGQIENLGHQHNENVEALPHSDGNDIYNNLGDLVNFGRLSEGAGDFSFSYNDYCYPNQSFLGDNTPFLELDDLDAPLNGPVEAGTSELIHTDGLSSNQHCYNPAQLSLKENLGLIQCPSIHHYNAEQSSLTVNPGLSQRPPMHCHNAEQSSLAVNPGLSQCPSMDCYNAEQSSLTVNPGLSQCPSMHCYNAKQSSLSVNPGLSQCPSMHYYNAEQSSLTVNPQSSQFPSVLPEQYRFEDQWAAFPKS
ncbi:NAC domain-containing protein 82-like [Pistacia vera]|uniref:NAC domain-containing protein 82-like n=1 Tax=Pistacia vera TaxID=55513 RepID=UPI001263AA85|nr:NAC domain-containing protein 82-like [Pistacia vera]